MLPAWHYPTRSWCRCANSPAPATSWRTGSIARSGTSGAPPISRSTAPCGRWKTTAGCRRRVVVQRGRPDKKVYTVSDAGRAELARWIAAPLQAGRGGALSDTRTRDVAVKLRGAAYGDPAALRTQIIRAARRTRPAAGHLPRIREETVPRPVGAARQRATSISGAARRHPRRGKHDRLARRSDQRAAGPETGEADDLSKPVVPVGSRVHHAAQPGDHGFDAHRSGGPCQPYRPARRVLRRTRPRRRRPDHHRWLRAQPDRLVAAVRLGAGLLRAGAPAPSHHQRGARSGRQDPAADPARRTLCVPPTFGERVVDQGADQPVSSAPALVARRAEHDRRLRALRAAGPRGRLRRRRNHGQ